jgi:hypothetical protein
MREFLENQRGVLPNGYCVRERLSKMGHAQVQVALYNGTGWNDLSIQVIVAASKFKRNLTKVRARKVAEQAEQYAHKSTLCCLLPSRSFLRDCF